MRGRTNYTGGAMPVINGEIKNYEVAQGSIINKGDFVELIYEYITKTFVGFQTSSQRVIKLTNGLFVVALRAKVGYQWTLYLVDFTDGNVTIKSTRSLAIGTGTINRESDLKMCALDDDYFVVIGVRCDGYIGQGTLLYQVVNEEFNYLAQDYHNQDTGSSNPTFCSVCAGSDKRIVTGWYVSNVAYYRVLSYANGTLEILKDKVAATGGADYYDYPANMLNVPGKNRFVTLQAATSGSSSYYTLCELMEDNTIYAWAYVNSKVNPKDYDTKNVAFIDETRMMLLSGFEDGSSSSNKMINSLVLFRVGTSALSVISTSNTKNFTNVQTDNTGGALASLGNGYFVTVEGKGLYSTGSKVNVISLWHLDEFDTITLISTTQFKRDQQYEIAGNGFIITDEDYNCIYVEDDSENATTSYMSFKIVNMDHIVTNEGGVYIKEYVKRAEGFANQSGVGGDVIEIYVPV